MQALHKIFNQLPDRMYPNRKNDSHIFTPLTIAKEMIDALPDDIWNSKSTFLDICCKSGALLYEIYAKLMNSKDLIIEFPDTGERRKHIVNKQIFGISPDQACQLLSTRAVYGCIVENSHIIYLENYTNVMTNSDTRFLIETLKREFGTMKFDVVVGNPPYNKGMDLDFVDTGYKLLRSGGGTQVTCV